MNGFLAFLHQAAGVLQQVGAWLAGHARQEFDVLSAIAVNRPEPARNVIVYALVLLALVSLAPRALKKFSK
jgi:hypothetical protein